MRLSWNEIRARAATFADEWSTAHYEKGQTQTFCNELFEVFGVKRRKEASFEEPCIDLEQGRPDKKTIIASRSFGPCRRKPA